MKRILIIRPSAIGDVVMASPILPVLREAYPDCHIAWLVDPSLADLLRHNPLLDETIPWSKSHWKSLLKQGCFGSLLAEIRTLRNDLRKRRFDLAIDAQGLLRSRLLAWLSGAPKRVGFESREPGTFLMTQVVSRTVEIHRMSSEYRHLLRSLNLPLGRFQMHLALSETDKRFAFDTLKRAGVGPKYAVFCPFTTRAQKQWVRERWAQLAETVINHHNLEPVFLGGPGDMEESMVITAMVNGPVHSLAGKTDLTVSAAIVAEASMVIGVDTGLTHMGIAFNRPTVALFGATCPYLETDNDNAAVIYHRRRCSPCRRKPTCDGDYPCMKAITVDQVVDTVSRLLQKGDEHR